MQGGAALTHSAPIPFRVIAPILEGYSGCVLGHFRGAI